MRRRAGHPRLLMLASFVALAVAAVLILLLTNATTGFGGPDYSGAWPGFVLGAIALAGLVIGMLSWGRRPR